MADIDIKHHSETYVRLDTSPPIILEIKEHFQFYAKGYQFDPRYKSGFWDGKLSSLKVRERLLPKGLLPQLVKFMEHNNYSYTLSDKVVSGFTNYEVDEDKVRLLYEKIDAPFEPMDVQIDAVKHSINNGRSIVIAPTAMGKSYIIHGLASFHSLMKHKTIVIVDRSQLVLQLRENLEEEYNGKEHFKYATCYDKDIDFVNPDCDVFFTTWQSVIDQPDHWFEQFDVVIGDEIHVFKAKSLITIFDKLNHVRFRYGFTATLDNDSQTDRLTIVGLFGTPHRVATIKELIEAGVVARPIVYAMVLEYPDSLSIEFNKRKFKSATEYFQAEVALFEEHEGRNNFIANLAQNVKGNKLIAFKNVDHGKRLLEKMPDAYFIYGQVKKKKRFEISKEIDTLKESTSIVSVGTFSTGINIKNINSIINACQLQSKITVPQLVGRGMRKGTDNKKDVFYLFDLGDYMPNKGKDNITFKHFKERLNMYAEFGFEVKIKKLKMY